METFSSLFQCSSSPSSTSHMSLLTTVDSSIVQPHDLQICSRGNGMLGLITNDNNMEAPPNSDISNACQSNGTEAEVKSGKKKGEKKVRKPRYAFQTRSQVDILDDGYRWRKYGQKAVKNNKFPRSYYRCTHQGCNVKKQVQRLSKDEGVVVTTYEGMHSHPIEKSTDNFEHILSQMQIYSSF